MTTIPPQRNHDWVLLLFVLGALLGPGIDQGAVAAASAPSVQAPALASSNPGAPSPAAKRRSPGGCGPGPTVERQGEGVPKATSVGGWKWIDQSTLWYLAHGVDSTGKNLWLDFCGLMGVWLNFAMEDLGFDQFIDCWWMLVLARMILCHRTWGSFACKKPHVGGSLAPRTFSAWSLHARPHFSTGVVPTQFLTCQWQFQGP